jgi:hypothetical protein
MMANSSIPSILVYQQGNDVAPPPDGYEQITNPLNPILRSASRLAHFSDGVYDLSAESHIIRLLKTLLGDAGVGGVQKQMLLIRLQQSIGGTHFFDLDSFYGGIFGITRSADEHLPIDPQTDLVPISQWDEIRISDGSYRSRAARLTTAIQLGATAKGIEAVAEAVSGIEFDVIEGWMYPSYKQYTFDFWESSTWDQMEAFTWDQLEWSESATNEVARNVITLYPHEILSAGARFDIERIIDRIKPVNVIVRISDIPPDQEILDVPFTALATSERWEIRQLVRNSRINGILPYPDQPEDTFIEPPTPPWANYSGEAWTVLDRAPRTLAYSTPAAIVTTEQLDATSVDMPPQPFLQIPGTTQIVSLPEYALKPVQGLYSGRSVSDGIITINPYGDRVSSETQMSIDRIDASFISNQITSATRSAQRFWTTPIRASDDLANEVLGIRFDELVTVNHISFDYARFPCVIDVQYWDRGIGQWTTVGSVLNRDSSPYGIGNQPPPDALHSFHYGSDHWAKTSLSFEASVAQEWRIVMSRRLGTGPVGINGTRIPYPLGIRDLDIGYRVTSFNGVPHVAPNAPVNTGRNIVGLQTQYYLERARAEYVTDSLPTAWVCTPQVIRDAIVNLYLKVSATIPQIVNQIYVDPVHPGVLCNMYYTASIPQGTAGAQARDDIVTPVGTEGNINAQIGGENRGLTIGAGQPAWVDIDIHSLGGGTGQIWMGREYILGDMMKVAGTPYAAYLDVMANDDGQITLIHGVANSGGHYTYFIDATRNGLKTRLAWPTDFIPAKDSRLRLCVDYTATDLYPVILAQIEDGQILDSRTPVNTAVNGFAHALAAVSLAIGIERFGSTPNYSLARLTMAANGFGSGPYLRFFEDPSRYAVIPISGTHDDVNGTFLRFYPSYIGWSDSEVFSLGFVGGAPDVWDMASWTPIGQFILSKGVFRFPDVVATGLKMEFSNLIAEPYDAFIPINSQVSRIANVGTEDQGASMDDLTQAAIDLHSINRFQDLVSGVVAGQDVLINYVSPTTGVVVIDGTVRDQGAIIRGFGYNFAQWHSSGRGAIQQTVGIHSYLVGEVQPVSRTAFFVGLRSVSLRRNVTRNVGDGKAYDDSLLDTLNVDVPNTTFEIEPGQIFTPESASNAVLVTPRVALSKAYYSRRPVTAIQFSTQQTGPVQLLPDDEFRDPALISYTFSSVDNWHSSGDGIVFWDQGNGTVRVSRNPSVLDAFYGPDTPIVHPPVSPVLASGFARTVTLNFNSYGGISSPSVTISPGGVVYAACRVAAWSELQADLKLRIYGSDGTTKLAEKSFRPQVRVPTEVVLPYVILGTSIDSAISVRLEQDGPYMDSWLMYSMSGFDTSVLWEFSVDDGTTWMPGSTVRSLLYGVVQMPTPGCALKWRVTAYRNNCIIDAIRIRPWYLNRLGSET